MDDLKKYVEDYKYLTIDDEGEYMIHTSLRKMAASLSCDYSTISKKLKESGHYYCINKETQKPIYIKKLQ